jgi:hypothetical protein
VACIWLAIVGAALAIGWHFLHHLDGLAMVEQWVLATLGGTAALVALHWLLNRASGS